MLSVETSSLREEVAESKDPYSLFALTVHITLNGSGQPADCDRYFRNSLSISFRFPTGRYRSAARASAM